MPVEPTIKLGSIAAFEMGQSPPSSVVVEGDAGVPFLQGCADFGQRYPQPHCSCLRPPKLCNRGDVLISVRAPVGTVNKADREYCIGRGLAAVKMIGDYPDNYGWHLLGYWAPDLRRVAQGTTFEAVGRNDLANLDVVDIPPEGRSVVATTLDAADEAVAKTEALIGKLKAIRAGLLHDLLTRGLDDNGELRDPTKRPGDFITTSLGTVPRAWQVVRLGDQAGVYGGKRLPGGHAYTTEDTGLLYLRVIDFYQREPDFGTLVRIEQRTFDLLSRYEIYADNLYISIAGSLGYAGVFRPSSGVRAILTENAARIVPDSQISPAFLALQLNSPLVQRQINQAKGISSGVPKLALCRIQSLNVALPSPGEQERIEKSIVTHDARIRSEEVYLGRLRSLKKGLMQDLLNRRVRVGRQEARV